MASSAADARAVIAVEKLLCDGAVIYSEQVGGQFFFKITVPAFTMTMGTTTASEPGEEYTGWGATLTDAINDAYQQLPAEVAA